MKDILLKDTSLPTRLKNSIFWGFNKNRNRFARTGKKDMSDFRNEITLGDVAKVKYAEWSLAFRNFGKASHKALEKRLLLHGFTVIKDYPKFIDDAKIILHVGEKGSGKTTEWIKFIKEWRKARKKAKRSTKVVVFCDRPEEYRNVFKNKIKIVKVRIGEYTPDLKARDMLVIVDSHIVDLRSVAPFMSTSRQFMITWGLSINSVNDMLWPKIWANRDVVKLFSTGEEKIKWERLGGDAELLRIADICQNIDDLKRYVTIEDGKISCNEYAFSIAARMRASDDNDNTVEGMKRIADKLYQYADYYKKP